MYLNNTRERVFESTIYIKMVLFSYLLLFIYACTATSSGPEPEVSEIGAVQVIVETNGLDQDRNGYIVNIDLQKTLSSSTNDTLLFEDVEQGARQLGVEDLDNECSIPAGNPREITVVAQNTVQTTIEVQCEEVVLKNKIVYRHCYSICDGLYVMDSDGSNPVQLTNDSWDSNPVISPDGTKVAFTNGSRDAVNGEFNSEIYVVDASGSPVTRLTFTRETTRNRYPTWSPDGQKIAFSQHRDGLRNIVVIDADGTGMERLTSHSYSDNFPTWSPDGSKIAFISTNRPIDHGIDIFMMNTDGSGIKQLTNDSHYESRPIWSPDGEHIIYETQGPPNKIFAMNSDGSGIRQLINDNVGEVFSSWSADGNQIIFNRSDDIYRVNLDGTGLTNLTNTPEISESDPHWSPVQ